MCLKIPTEHVAAKVLKFMWQKIAEVKISMYWNDSLGGQNLNKGELP
jgi:hypothetical protein